MIITGGFLKGRKIVAPSGNEVRPTSSRVRQAVFNMLGQDLSEGVFLDLFAGTGLVGLEAISRGAKRVIFVELDGQIVRLLRDNIMKCNVEDRAKIICDDWRRGMFSLLTEFCNIDYMYIDPPYKLVSPEEILKEIKKFRLKEDAKIIIEHGKPYKTFNVSDDFEIVKQKKYGDTHITIISGKR